MMTLIHTWTLRPFHRLVFLKENTVLERTIFCLLVPVLLLAKAIFIRHLMEICISLDFLSVFMLLTVWIADMSF